MKKEGKFWEQLNQAEHTPTGLYVWKDWFQHTQKNHNSAIILSSSIEDTYRTLNDHLPWDTKPRLGGERLKQHAYYCNRTESARQIQEYPGLQLIEDLCDTLERTLDVDIDDVFCNRFVDPNHRIRWHRDTYGTHILVLSFGSERTIQFRPNKNPSKIESLRPTEGTLYLMPLHMNSTHEHCVVSSSHDNNSTDSTDRARISLVFFLTPPAYAQRRGSEFRITWCQKLRGLITSAFEQPSNK